jgi:hypothetical protein
LENRLLRRIFETERDEVRLKWRKISSEKFHAVYSLPNIMQVIKSTRLKLAGNVARMMERSGAYTVLVRRLEGKNHLEDLDVGERIILKWIFKHLFGVLD